MFNLVVVLASFFVFVRTVESWKEKKPQFKSVRIDRVLIVSFVVNISEIKNEKNEKMKKMKKLLVHATQNKTFICALIKKSLFSDIWLINSHHWGVATTKIFSLCFHNMYFVSYHWKIWFLVKWKGGQQSWKWIWKVVTRATTTPNRTIMKNPWIRKSPKCFLYALI